jgi:hypothetical protein
MKLQRQRLNWDLLSEMHKDIKEIKEQLIPDIRTELGVLKTRNGIWSSATGLIGGALALITMKMWK